MRRTRAARFPLPHGLTSLRFVVSVGALLAAGLVALLTVNTSLAAGAITLGSLESDLARATERQEALAAEVEALDSPASLQAAAWALGMVPAASPAFLDPSTGTLSGALVPAPAAAKPFEQAPQVKPLPTAEPEQATGDPPAGGTPAPIPTAPAPADPGADGAIITLPGAGPSPGPPTSGTAGAAGTTGDGAAMSIPGGTGGPSSPGGDDTAQVQ